MKTRAELLNEYKSVRDKDETTIKTWYESLTDEERQTMNDYVKEVLSVLKEVGEEILKLVERES